jgi:hypothetical protein
MPVILRPEAHEAWLRATADDAHAAIEQYPTDLMVVYRVGLRMNSPKNDDPALIEPTDGEPREPDQNKARDGPRRSLLVISRGRRAKDRRLLGAGTVIAPAAPPGPFSRRWAGRFHARGEALDCGARRAHLGKQRATIRARLYSQESPHEMRRALS